MKTLVVGAGAIGLCCAQALAKRGAEVTVVDRSAAGRAASAGNAGWVTPGLSAPIPAPGVLRQALRWMLDGESPLLVRPRFDRDFWSWTWRFARACRPGPHQAGTAATLALARTAEDCFDALREDGVEFEMHADGLLYLMREPDGLAGWLEMYDALDRLGFDGDVRPLDAAAVRELEPAVSDGVVAGLLARHERHVRPESLTDGLVAWLRGAGVTLHEHEPVVRFARSAGRWRVQTPAREIVADRVVVAAGVWSKAVLALVGVHLPLEAAKGYSITASPAGTVPRRPLYFTEAKVGLSPFRGRVRLAGTLELNGIDLRLDRRRVESIARTAADYLRDWRPTSSRVDWAGLRPLAADGVPIVGAVPGHDGLFVATGHAMLGITLAPSTGEALAPAILGDRVDPALAPLALDRFTRANRRSSPAPVEAPGDLIAQPKGAAR